MPGMTQTQEIEQKNGKVFVVTKQEVTKDMLELKLAQIQKQIAQGKEMEIELAAKLKKIK